MKQYKAEDIKSCIDVLEGICQMGVTFRQAEFLIAVRNTLEGGEEDGIPEILHQN